MEDSLNHILLLNQNTETLLYNVLEVLRKDEAELWPAFKISKGYSESPTLKLKAFDTVSERIIVLPINTQRIFVITNSSEKSLISRRIRNPLNGNEYEAIITVFSPRLQEDVLFFRDVVYAKRKG